MRISLRARFSWQKDPFEGRTGVVAKIGVTIVGLAVAGAARADTIRFSNGDRLEGTVLSATSEMIEFESTRFGRLSVHPAEVTLERSSKPAEPGAGTQGESSAIRASGEVRVPMAEAPAKHWYDPWHGKVGVTFDFRSDGSEHESIATTLDLRRTWTTDALELWGFFDYEENDNRKSTDLWKGSIKWRHDFPRAIFTNVRTMAEWNRGHTRSGRKDPYVLLQEELGAGRTLIDSPDRKLRTGVAGNLLTVQGRSGESDTLRTAVSAFVEFEIKLPWETKLSERGAVYRSLRRGDVGVENTFELSRKLTSALSLGVRHEYRENLPEVRVEDLRRLRVLLGLEF